MHILLTGSRAPVTLELARLFNRDKHTVFVADTFRNTLTSVSRAITRSYVIPPPNTSPDQFCSALCQILSSENIDLLIPTCEEIFWIAKYYEQLSEYCQVFCVPLDQLRPLHSKWEFIQRATCYSLPVPQTQLLTSQAQIQPYNWALVYKPVFSRFSTQTHFWQPGQPLPHIDPSPKKPWIAQDYLEGLQYCSYSIANQGRLAAHTCYQAHFTAGQGAAVHFQHLEHAQIQQWVETFITRESFTGQIAFDFVQTSEGVAYALECNPRATSGIHLLATQPEFASVFCSHSVNLVHPNLQTQAMLSAAMIVYGLPQAWARHELGLWTTAFAQAHDVIFEWGDLRPALWQFISLAYFATLARQQHISPLEASTLDIEWNGE